MAGSPLGFDVESAQKELERAGEVHARVSALAEEVAEKRSVTHATAQAGELTLVYEVADEYGAESVPGAVLSWAHENGLTLRSNTVDPNGTFVTRFFAIELTELSEGR